jgi:hypothetical protein
MANLFIALGGSGLKTVREIREKNREGDYFLFIDTDTNDLVDTKESYQICLTNNINNYYPHIDVRFKNAMSNSLHDVESQQPILNVLNFPNKFLSDFTK